jgi:hypothetical protein
VTQEQLEQACREWQKRLRLQDWEVAVKFTDWGSFSILGRCGECSRNLQHRFASISVLRPEQYRDDAGECAPADWEMTLVHELLECHFAPFKADDGLERTAQEQVINALADTLVGLKREAVGGET